MTRTLRPRKRIGFQEDDNFPRLSSDDEDFASPSHRDCHFEGSSSRGLDDNGKGKAVVEVLDSDSHISLSDYVVSDSDFSSDSSVDLIDLDLNKESRKRGGLKGRRRRNGKLQEEEKEKAKGKEEVVFIDDYEAEEGHVNHVGRRERKKSKKKRGRNKNVDRPVLLWEVWEEENKRWVDEHEAEDIDLDCMSEEVTETAEASPDLLLPLLRYQKEWLAWALKQEDSTTRGGILADEMGMGKTIQAIALVLAKRAFYKSINDSVPSVSSPLTPGKEGEINCTLVICPVVAVTQWVNEISKYTSEGSTKVLVYHGSNRRKTPSQFADYDFVFTTYSIVEAEYRKNVMPPKDKCMWCGKLFYSNKLKYHLKYFCGPDAIKTDKQSKQVTKKAKYESKSSSSKDPADKDIEEKGAGKKGKKQVWQANQDKGLGVGSSEGSPVSMAMKTSILHSVRWNRIILDEAHFIKDRRSNTARAVLALESSFKWALSGTPLQNRVGELYSLVRFLRMTPYSYYFCRDCDCMSLDYSVTAECASCPHKAVRHFCWWNKYVATPIQTSGSSNEGRRAMILLKHRLLNSILLRRTKKGRAADLALPPRIVSMRRDLLDVKELDYYESLYNESQLQFNTYVESGTLMNNYAHIFDLLTRLRQAVDHPYLVIYSNSAAQKAGDNTNNGEMVCAICHDPAEDPVVTSCQHVFCKACLTDFSATLGQALCPSCSKPLTADFTTRVNLVDQGTKANVKGFRSASILNKICLNDFQTSSKIEALREEIFNMVENDGSAKAIVFSQFTQFLDLIRYSLQKSGVECAQLVGSMSMGARDTAIKRFTDDPDCRIFLMSLKAGGVALNLTVASHVFLMDPWWNPAVERQAQDRIHRIGQYKPIRIVRFIIENTIEERILKLQEKKELVFEGTVGGSKEALIKLTEEDLRFLFAS